MTNNKIKIFDKKKKKTLTMFLNVFDKMINSTQCTHKTVLNTN